MATGTTGKSGMGAIVEKIIKTTTNRGCLNMLMNKNLWIGIGIIFVVLVLLITNPHKGLCNVAYIPLHGYMTTYIPSSEATTLGTHPIRPLPRM